MVPIVSGTIGILSCGCNHAHRRKNSFAWDDVSIKKKKKKRQKRKKETLCTGTHKKICATEIEFPYLAVQIIKMRQSSDY